MREFKDSVCQIEDKGRILEYLKCYGTGIKKSKDYGIMESGV